MPKFINLVCTRCTDGKHAALQHWYNDHAQLLMASKELQHAQLFRFKGTTASMDYFCLYQFSQLEHFAAFDSGDVMGQVRELSHAAPGRSSVEIVKRTQYERVLHRRWLAGEGGFVQASLFVWPSDHSQQATRWLNDTFYVMHLKHPLQTAQVYAKDANEQTELLVLLESASSVPLPLDWHMWESLYAPRPSIQMQWQAQAERIAQWLR